MQHVVLFEGGDPSEESHTHTRVEEGESELESNIYELGTHRSPFPK